MTSRLVHCTSIASPSEVQEVKCVTYYHFNVTDDLKIVVFKRISAMGNKHNFDLLRKKYIFAILYKAGL